MADLGDHSVFLVIDELGIDPLRDKAIEAIQKVESFSMYEVKAHEQHNAPLLAYNVYRNENYWWHILIYNALDDMWELKAGMRIKIPDMNAMVTRLTSALTANKPKTTVRF